MTTILQIRKMRSGMIGSKVSSNPYKLNSNSKTLHAPGFLGKPESHPHRDRSIKFVPLCYFLRLITNPTVLAAQEEQRR